MIVSVIVPNYNHAAFLEQRLKSIYNQTYQDYEVILLDDRSTDNSQKILSKYKEHPKTSYCIFNEVNSGSPFKQWNKGVALARGEYIWIAESDDFCSDIFLETLVKYIEKEDTALAYCQSYRVNSKNELKGTWLFHTKKFRNSLFERNFVLDGNEFLEKFLIHKNVIPNVSAVLFKRKELEKVMPLTQKPFLRYNADWYYYVQLLCNSKVGFIAQPLNYFRFHETSVIAGASIESGWLKIFQMEMQGRNFMREYLKKCKPANLNSILSISKKSDQKLKKNTVTGFLDKKQFSAVKFIIRKYPELLPFSFLYYIRKRISK